jgi:hypothetical protein
LLVMMAVISSRRVGRLGPKTEVRRWGRHVLVQVLGGGVRTVTSMAVMVVTAWGRWPPWLR